MEVMSRRALTLMGSAVSLANIHALLRLLPELPLGKILLGILLLLNIRAFPFVWHVRVFSPFYPIFFQRSLISLRTLFHSRKAKQAAVNAWAESLSPIGLAPFSPSAVVSYTSWASIDESDYNLHLSNSSYAKALDTVRTKAGVRWCPQFFKAGGMLLVGGTTFTFLREIPILSEYEVRMSIGGWDDKWIYAVARFVSKPKGKDKDLRKRYEPMNRFLHVPIVDTTPGLSTFAPTPMIVPPSNANGKLDIKSLTARLSAIHEEPDGAILHTVSISQVCCKVGRITVPPGLVFAMNGMCAPVSNTSVADNATPPTPYSHTNPPPHWSHVRALIESNTLTEFYKGGWKNMPVSERWWNSVSAMGGVVEEQRKERMETLGLLRRCMDGVKGMR